VSIVTGLRAGRPGFDPLQGQGIFLFATASRSAVGPTQSPVQRMPAVKRSGREADQSPPSSAQGKIAPLSRISSWHCPQVSTVTTSPLLNISEAKFNVFIFFLGGRSIFICRVDLYHSRLNIEPCLRPRIIVTLAIFSLLSFR
jgi:hypothetical protein